MAQDLKLQEMMAKAVDFHGHSCPGLALGVVASKIALETAKRAEDEELVAVVENDACGIDAIQALTGCTYGKGNLIHNDFGKSVYTFYNHNTGKTIRLALKSDVFSTDDETKKHSDELFEKIRTGTATETEITEHNKLRQERIDSILESGEKLFNINEVDTTPPDKARIFDSFICERCGELTMETRVCEKENKKFCIPCCKEIEKSKNSH